MSINVSNPVSINVSNPVKARIEGKQRSTSHNFIMLATNAAVQHVVNGERRLQRSQNWCFTRNNPTAGWEVLLQELYNREGVEYIIVGRETGASGTPHLQGFVRFRARRRFGVVQRLLPQGCHIEIARGSPEQNRAYCSKEDAAPFVRGTCPTLAPGKRSDIERFCEWCKESIGPPSERDIMEEFPSLYLRYRGNLLKMSKELCSRGVLSDVEFRAWQRNVIDVLDEPADNRHIHFYVDEVGNTGKSWLCRRLLKENPRKVQVLRVGKRDDLAHAIDESKSVFLFDIPRTGMQFLQYDVLEMLKDGLVFSPKYQSMMKEMKGNVHVLVFCNEEPDRTKMSRDRYVVTHLRTPNSE